MSAGRPEAARVGVADGCDELAEEAYRLALVDFAVVDDEPIEVHPAVLKDNARRPRDILDAEHRNDVRVAQDRQRRNLAVRPRASPSGDFALGARGRGAVVVDDLRVERRDPKSAASLSCANPCSTTM